MQQSGAQSRQWVNNIAGWAADNAWRVMTVSIEQSSFGISRSGEPVDRYRLSNGRVSVDIITYGGIITSWRCPDRHGNVDDIVLGYDTLADYEDCQIYMGCIAGRYANRIADGRFTLHGQSYQLEQNNNGHHLHGGSHGFHKKVWQARTCGGSSPAVELSLVSENGAGGYPGNLTVSICYALGTDNSLSIRYRAVTDQPTIINLTSHSYFNLRGHQHAGEDGALAHQLLLNAPHVLAVDSDAIPTGVLDPVAGTAFDFISPRTIAKRIFDQPGLYDHCYALNTNKTPAALLHEPVSGRALEVSTSLPGLQLYSAGFVDNCRGRGEVIYGRRGSLCLEAQLFPDAPNQPSFASAELHPDTPWEHCTTYRPTTDHDEPCHVDS
ncbi:MAG: aldose epimerase family protein [Pseudomonadota bacterium]